MTSTQCTKVEIIIHYTSSATAKKSRYVLYNMFLTQSTVAKYNIFCQQLIKKTEANFQSLMESATVSFHKEDES